MTGDWGRQRRLSRIFDSASRRTVMLAVDHGYFLGPTTGMERPRDVLPPLLPFADALMATRGVVRTAVDPLSPVSVVLRISGGPSVVGATLTDEVITTSLEDAVRLDAAAVAVSVFVGADHERQTIENLARAVNQSYAYDIPVLAVTAVGKELGDHDARYMALASRICAEIGADVVKTYYADGFADVVDTALVPVVIAGGKQLATRRDALQLAHDAVSVGAAGVDFGRNVWQSDQPVHMLQALRAIVHNGESVDRAHAIFDKRIELAV